MGVKKSGCVVALCLLATMAAAEPGRGLYVEGHWGNSAPRESDAFREYTDENDDRQREDFRVEFKEGHAEGGKIGYAYARTRLELEVARSFNKILDPAAEMLLTDDYETLGIFFNFITEFRPGKSIRPFVRVGAGRARIDIDGASERAGALQVGGGFEFQLGSRFVLATEARFVDFGEITYRAEDPENGTTDFGVNMDGYQYLAALRFDVFGVPDSDRDGVKDNVDACPGTAKGTPVDANGCPRDSDGDGVTDMSDRCPQTERGAKVDEDGCVNDEDNDGVADSSDRCPASPRGTRVDRNGCPLDSDEDGVEDAEDECPNTPRGSNVLENGCGPEQNIVLKGVNFEYNKSKLLPEAKTILDDVARILNAAPGFDVEIQGHTDARASEEYNQWLSERRARSVKNYLVDQGVAEERLQPVGYGESEPVASNETDAGRAKNRRVELKIIERE